MPSPTPLAGKKVLIASSDRFNAHHITGNLENMGSTMVHANSPHTPENVPEIIKAVQAEKPDAIIIHLPTLYTEEGRQATEMLAEQLKDRKVPTFVVGEWNTRDDLKEITDLMKSGVIYIDNNETIARDVAYKVSRVVNAQTKATGLPTR